MSPSPRSRVVHGIGEPFPFVELAPADLLSSDGFAAGTLCELLPAAYGHTFPPGADPLSWYVSSRHLLRFLVHEHLIAAIPRCAEHLVDIDIDRPGSPLRVVCYDDEGCPLRSLEETLRTAPVVTVPPPSIVDGLARTYPLRGAAEITLYDALVRGRNARHHDAVRSVLSVSTEGPDVLLLAAEILVVSGAAGTTFDEAVGAARSLLA